MGSDKFPKQVEERAVPVEELLDGDEVFCTGTAVSIVPVGSITYLGKRYVTALLSGFLSPSLG